MIYAVHRVVYVSCGGWIAGKLYRGAWLLWFQIRLLMMISPSRSKIELLTHTVSTIQVRDIQIMA